MTHLTTREKIQLFKLARRTEGLIVEIGSFLGASACFLSAGARAGSNDGPVICVDTWMNDAMGEDRRDTFAEFQQNTQAFSSRIQVVRDWSTAAGASHRGSIQLLFIDADHCYEAVKADWDAWSGHLAKDATVVFHDIGWAEGVQRVVAEEVEPAATDAGRLPNMYWARWSGS